MVSFHKTTIKVVCVFIFLLLTPVSYAKKTQTNDELPFLTLADFHFNPFISCHETEPCPLILKLKQASTDEWAGIFEKYDKEAPQYRQDTNYALLKSSLAAAKKTVEERHIKFVVILGDYIGHENRDNYKRYTKDNSLAGYQLFVKKTMQFLTMEFAETFPRIDVYNLIGNNDSYHHDYVCVPGGPFFKDMGAIWSALIKTSTNRQLFRKSFPEGGYYSLLMPGAPNVRLIALNTVYFSYKAENTARNDDAAKKELSWFHDELNKARLNHERVIVAMHIPQGVDIYASIKVKFFRLIDLWKPDFTKQFEDDLQEFAPELLALLSGHLHSDWSQMLSLDNKHAISISGTTSISPIFGNNPGYKVYTYSLGKQLLEKADVYVYPMDKSNSWSVIYQYNYYHNDQSSMSLSKVRVNA